MLLEIEILNKIKATTFQTLPAASANCLRGMSAMPLVQQGHLWYPTQASQADRYHDGQEATPRAPQPDTVFVG